MNAHFNLYIKFDRYVQCNVFNNFKYFYKSKIGGKTK